MAHNQDEFERILDEIAAFFDGLELEPAAIEPDPWAGCETVDLDALARLIGE